MCIWNLWKYHTGKEEKSLQWCWNQGITALLFWVLGAALQLLQKVTLPFGIKFHLLFYAKLYYNPNSFSQWTNWSFLPAIIVLQDKILCSRTLLYDVVVNDAVWFHWVWLNQLVKLELIPELSIKYIPFCLTLLNLVCKFSTSPLRLVGNLFLWSGVSSPSFSFWPELFSMGCWVDFCSSCCALSCNAQRFALATRQQEEEENLALSLGSASSSLSVAIGICVSFPSPHLLPLLMHLGKVFGTYL